MRIHKLNWLRSSLYVLLAAAFLSACSGEDYTLAFFPPMEKDKPAATPSGTTSGKKCTVQFTSQLCVVIKGDKIEAGTADGEKLCAEVPPFPIHITGQSASILGKEFPDIDFEGGGLPAPIKINGKGDADGTENRGSGTVDEMGNITINGFSLYILALGVVGEIPNLTLTTGSTEEVPNLGTITGSPPDTAGAMTIVAATTLGHIIDAADKYLMGAALTATFTGKIEPTFSQCGGESERAVEVKRLTIASDGVQTETNIPAGERMEVSSGTFIADSAADVGERFEAHAKFRAKNISMRAQKYSISSKIGPFYITSLDPLAGTIAPQRTITLDVVFRPSAPTITAGEITESISIGAARFMLVGKALAKSSSGIMNVLDDDGKVKEPNVRDVEMGSTELSANSERAFFKCSKIACGEKEALTSCTACNDASIVGCELLSISTKLRPIGEVDGSCNLIDKEEAPLTTIDLNGDGATRITAQKQVVSIRNMGVTDMKITGISIEESKESKSRGQFLLSQGAIFIGKSFASVQEEVSRALDGNGTQGATFPITLPPFQPGYNETSVYIVVIYEPNDLIGSDGTQVGPGSKVTDLASLRVSTDKGEMQASLSGETTVRESPPLELYFKTSTGLKFIADGQDFQFKGVTTETQDIAVPLFLRSPDTASKTIRITSIAVEGEGSAQFRWLDSADRISSVQPPSGKGMRCSIPITDGATGNMIDEKFDLKPVSLSGKGFDLKPGAYSTETMPLFGCIDFHRESSTPVKKIYRAKIKITGQEIDSQGNPAKNPDGSMATSELTAELIAALNPRMNKLVMRVTQTVNAILNPQNPALAATPSYDDKVAWNSLKEEDLQIITGGVILDPFDEMTIKSSDGSRIETIPNDGVTGVFRAIDTHPVSEDYTNPLLFDFAATIYDATLPKGSRGVYDDYPNVPDNIKINGWRIFTSTLSYPGPLAPQDQRPNNPSDCLVVDPCSPEGLKKFTNAGVAPGEKGACAFFYGTGGKYDSPAFHTKSEQPDGEFENLCNRIGKKQTLNDADTGHYTVDGELTFEEVGMRFFGPTYVHNPGGPLGSKPPLDEVFHLAFTTGVLKPQSSPEDFDVLPEKRINISKSEFKVNLTDKSMETPAICSNNSRNVTSGGKYYSTWRYMEGLLFKDEAATVPTGCPEEGQKYTGGVAYLKGRPLDHETGIFSMVSVSKFGTSDDLTFAFKDVMMFVVMNGWLCNPEGSADDFEGSRCYDVKFNERDARSQISISK